LFNPETIRAIPISGLIATAPSPTRPPILDPYGDAVRPLPPAIDSPSAVGFALEAVVCPAQAQADWESQELCLLRCLMSGFGVLPS